MTLRPQSPSGQARGSPILCLSEDPGEDAWPALGQCSAPRGSVGRRAHSSILWRLFTAQTEKQTRGKTTAGLTLRFCRAGIRCSSGAPMPTLRSIDSLEGFRLRKAVILMVMIYYSERIGVKSSQGKGTWGRVQGRPGGSFHLPFPGESCGQLSFLPALMHMWYCPSRKFTRDLVAWVFIECQVHGVHHVTDLSYSVSSPSRGQGDTVWPKAPTINHIRSLGVTQGPR